MKKRNLVILTLLISGIIYGDINLDSTKQQKTKIETTRNGNDIINIETPNSRGISVNEFENFQTKNGVVFNNSAQQSTTQLEGVISGNTNITGEQAKLILNKVNGVNRTEIEGILEATGTEAAEMIFSSPAGIYLNGVKFLGFKDVTFTTAPVNLDGNGDIQVFTVDSGKTEIGRNGVDASKLEQLALLSKEIFLDGEINGKNINLIAGEYDYNNADKNYTIKNGTGNTGIILSSSEFGSIYGDQINIIANNGELALKNDIFANDKIFLDILYSNADIRGDLISQNEIHIINSGDTSIYGKVAANNSILVERGTNDSGSEDYLTLFGNMESQSITFDRYEKDYSKDLGSNIIQGSINALDKLTLFDNIKNYGMTLASNLEMSQKGEIFNSNTFSIWNNVTGNGKIVNELGKAYIGGDLFVSDLTILSGDIYVEGNITSESVENEAGTLVVAKDLNILSNRQDKTTNTSFTNRGYIYAENININLKNYPVPTFYNEGTVYANNSMEIMSKVLVNKGELNSKGIKLTYTDFNTKEGKIVSDSVIHDQWTD